MASNSDTKNGGRFIARNAKVKLPEPKLKKNYADVALPLSGVTMMPNNSSIRAEKIKGIIAVNTHRGEQVCADKINQGGFPPPGHARKWGPEHIKPMMAGEISLKAVPKIKKVIIAAAVTRDIHDIIFRNSVSNSGFVRAAIMEKIQRDGLI